jgi:hypothetical protein
LPPLPTLPVHGIDRTSPKALGPAPKPTSTNAVASGSTTRLPPAQPGKRVTRSTSRGPGARPSVNIGANPPRGRRGQKVTLGIVPEEVEESVGETFEMQEVEVAVLNTVASSTTPSLQQEEEEEGQEEEEEGQEEEEEEEEEEEDDEKVDELESVGPGEEQPGEEFGSSDISADELPENKSPESRTRSNGKPPSKSAASRKQQAISKTDDRKEIPTVRLLRSTTRGNSVEVFPPPGTRARAHRDKAEQAQKAAEYVAPRGTRAAVAARRK